MVFDMILDVFSGCSLDRMLPHDLHPLLISEPIPYQQGSNFSTGNTVRGLSFRLRGKDSESGSQLCWTHEPYSTDVNLDLMNPIVSLGWALCTPMDLYHLCTGDMPRGSSPEMWPIICDRLSEATFLAENTVRNWSWTVMHILMGESTNVGHRCEGFYTTNNTASQIRCGGRYVRLVDGVNDLEQYLIITRPEFIDVFQTHLQHLKMLFEYIRDEEPMMRMSLAQDSWDGVSIHDVKCIHMDPNADADSMQFFEEGGW